jgi:hypothetical protein
MNRRLCTVLAILLACLPCVLLAQDADEGEPRAERRIEEDPRGGFSLLGGLFAYGFLFQIAAVIHWSRKRPDTFWLWIIIIGGFIGALAYFLIEGLPDLNQLGRTMKGPARRKRIRMLQVLILDNPSAGNYEELGELLLIEKRYADAREAFNRALAARTDSIDPFYRRAIALVHLREYEAAVADLQHVIAFDPKYDYSNAYCLYAKTLELQKKTEEAMAAFEQLVSRSHSAETLYEAARFFAENGREDDARELVQRIVMRELTMPRYQKRRDREWLRKSRALERRLRRGSAEAKDAPAV